LMLGWTDRIMLTCSKQIPGLVREKSENKINTNISLINLEIAFSLVLSVGSYSV